MVSEELRWVLNERECFNIEMIKVEILKFLRMNYINKFNNEMGGLDISNELRNYHRIYFGLRIRKWRLYIFFGMLVSPSQMHTLSTYVFITCTVLQGNIVYLNHDFGNSI